MTTKYNIIYTTEKNWVVARGIDIDVVSQGRTMKSAEKNIREAIELYIESFGQPIVPVLKSKPLIKSIRIPNYAQTATDIRQRSRQISAKTEIRRAAAKRQPRFSAKTHA